LERFGLPLSTWDQEDWPRLMRALEALDIKDTEATRIMHTQGKVEAKNISPAMWAKFQAHDELIAEVGDDGAIVN
jgi:hypothetical protein